MDASLLKVKPLPWHTRAEDIDAIQYCGEEYCLGGTFMVRLKFDPSVYFTGREFNFADPTRMGQGNKMRAKKSAWCKLAKVTQKALDEAIKAERARREECQEDEDIQDLRNRAENYGFKLVPAEDTSKRRFMTNDQSAGAPVGTVKELTLERALEITNWSERAIAHIVNLMPGENIIESGIYIERTS